MNPQRNVGSPLDHEEQVHLVLEARAGAGSARVRARAGAKTGEAGRRAARRELVERNLGLVVKVASTYRYQGYQGLSMEDLVQEGTIGLLRAIERFDPERGYRFSTYATFWIRQAIGTAVCEGGTLIKLSRRLRDKSSKVGAARRQLSSGLLREPTDEEIARQLSTGRPPGEADGAGEATAALSTAAAGGPAREGSRGGGTWKAAEVAEVRRQWSLALCVESLDRPIPRAASDTGSGLEGSSGPATVHALVADARLEDDVLGVEEARDEELEAERIRRALAGLSERQRHVLTRRYGLGGTESATLSEVGDELGMAKQTAHRLQRRAERRLKDLYEAQEQETTPPAYRASA